MFGGIHGVVSVVSRGPVEHQPGAREPRVRASHYHDVFVLILINSVHGLLKDVSPEELLPEENTLTSLFHEWKPFFVKRWMQDLMATVRYNDCFRSKRDLLLLLGEHNVPSLVVLGDHALLFDRRDQNLAILEQLNAGDPMTWVEDFSFHDCLYVVKNMVSRVIQKHSNHR